MKRLALPSYHVAVCKDTTGNLFSFKLCPPKLPTEGAYVIVVDVTHPSDIPQYDKVGIKTLRKKLLALPASFWDEVYDDDQQEGWEGKLVKKTLRFYSVMPSTCTMHPDDFLR